MSQLPRIETEAFALKGGMDLVSPALTLSPGAVFDSVNYEPDIDGGYRRMAGYERLDGRPSPSAADYWVIDCTLIGTVNAGDTLIGASSAVSAVVLLVNGSELIVTKLTGTFLNGENLQVTGVTKALFLSSVINGAPSPALNATYRSLAANNYRADITAVPGTGPVRGVWNYDGVIYAFRDVGANCVMYKATATGWTVVNSTLLAGGRFEFINYNFTGSATTQKMYFCDGVNKAQQWDGTTLTPVTTGMATDTPKYITAWKNMLVLVFASSVQLSGINTPLTWTALTGAAELGIGDLVTGVLPQHGDSSSGALAIFTKSTTDILYGNSSADFKKVNHSQDSGAAPYTAQNIGFAYFLDAKGIASLQSTQSYGNFATSTITRQIQPLIDRKRGLAVSSCIIRSSNQYRVFFNDGTGLIAYLDGDRPGGVMFFDYGSGRYMNTVASFVDSSGAERVLASGSDGYVYELNKGTSFDGGNILSTLFLAFNSSKRPRVRKHYRRAVIQAKCSATADVKIGYDLDYGGPATLPGVRGEQMLTGGGGYWDAMTWDNFNWDAAAIQQYTVDTPGNGTTIGLLIYGDSAINESYTIQSCILHYMLGRQER